MHGQVLDAKFLVEVGHCFDDCIDDVGDFVANDKLDVLAQLRATLAAKWSPMKRFSTALSRRPWV